MSKRFNDPAFEYLIRAFLTLQTPEECLHFLEDLCTESELAEMSRRLRAAKMLKKSYIRICRIIIHGTFKHKHFFLPIRIAFK